MPFIDIDFSEKVTENQQDEIKSRLGEIIDIIPNKTEEWLMIKIADDQKMYFSGKKLENGAYTAVNLHMSAPMENKGKLVEKIFEIYSDVLSINPQNVFITVSEFNNWGVEGKFV